MTHGFSTASSYEASMCHNSLLYMALLQYSFQVMRQPHLSIQHYWKKPQKLHRKSLLAKSFLVAPTSHNSLAPTTPTFSHLQSSYPRAPPLQFHPLHPPLHVAPRSPSARRTPLRAPYSCLQFATAPIAAAALTASTAATTTTIIIAATTTTTTSTADTTADWSAYPVSYLVWPHNPLPEKCVTRFGSTFPWPSWLSKCPCEAGQTSAPPCFHDGQAIELRGQREVRVQSSVDRKGLSVAQSVQSNKDDLAT